MPQPRVVLTDIEGTTTPIAFVRDVLFPHARARLPALLAEANRRPEVAREVAAIAELAPHAPPLDTLLGWLDTDAKVTPLKALQGIVWADGYADGSLVAPLYDDVPPALRGWHDAGVRLAVYSSGSIAAQQLLFGHSSAGDLRPLFSAWHDTTTGGKRDPASYRAIAPDPDGWLFLSDVAEELDAAAAAGLRTCQLVRPPDGTRPCDRHATAIDFAAVQAGW